LKQQFIDGKQRVSSSSITYLWSYCVFELHPRDWSLPIVNFLCLIIIFAFKESLNV